MMKIKQKYKRTSTIGNGVGKRVLECSSSQTNEGLFFPFFFFYWYIVKYIISKLPEKENEKYTK